MMLQNLTSQNKTALFRMCRIFLYSGYFVYLNISIALSQTWLRPWNSLKEVLPKNIISTKFTQRSEVLVLKEKQWAFLKSFWSNKFLSISAMFLYQEPYDLYYGYHSGKLKDLIQMHLNDLHNREVVDFEICLRKCKRDSYDVKRRPQSSKFVI